MNIPRFAAAIAALCLSPVLAQTVITVSKDPLVAPLSEISWALMVAVNGDVIEVDEIDPATPGVAATYERFALGTKKVTIRRKNPFASLRPIVDAAKTPGAVIPLYTAPAGVAVQIAGGQAKETIVDGLEITGATASGVVVTGSGPTIQNCIVRDCTTNGNGAGASLVDTTVEFKSCSFLRNTAIGNGGAVFVDLSTFGGPTAAKFIACAFAENNAAAGGAICIDEPYPVQVIVQGCSFQLNTAGSGGGIHAGEGVTLLVDYSTFDSNEATETGGAIALAYTQNCRLSNSVVRGNKAAGGFSQRGGGIHCYDEHEPTVVDNCLFVDNEAGEGGGAFVEASSTRFVRTTFADNDSASAGGGGAIYALGAPTIDTCILADNTSGSTTPWQESIGGTMLGTVRWTLWEGGTGGSGFDAITCIDAAPLFQNGSSTPLPPFSDFRYYLASSSPCIDTGSPLLTPDGAETTSQTLTPDTGVIDMGYHRNAKPLPLTVLSTSGPTISIATGGTVVMTIDTRALPPAAAGVTRFHGIATSLTGTHPGTAFDDIVVPIIADSFSLAVLNAQGAPFYDAITLQPVVLGAAPATGISHVNLTLPAGLSPSLLGVTMFTASFVFDTNGASVFDYRDPSSPVTTTLVP